LTGSGAESTFGHVLDAPQAVFHKMNEEHGFVDVRQCDRGLPSESACTLFRTTFAWP
jgi:D-serine deaminase-like pyridoxal phosphate-dependent protein